MPTLIEQRAAFTHDTHYSDLPPAVTQESKRLLLDSIGAALAEVDFPKGRIGIDFGRMAGEEDAGKLVGEVFSGKLGIQEAQSPLRCSQCR